MKTLWKQLLKLCCEEIAKSLHTLHDMIFFLIFYLQELCIKEKDTLHMNLFVSPTWHLLNLILLPIVFHATSSRIILAKKNRIKFRIELALICILTYQLTVKSRPTPEARNTLYWEGRTFEYLYRETSHNQGILNTK